MAIVNKTVQKKIVEKEVEIVVYKIELSQKERDVLENFLGDFNQTEVIERGFSKKDDNILNDIYQEL